jgi:hypothetical protein
MSGDPMDRLRRDSESTGVSEDENDYVLPKAFVEAWCKDYDIEAAQAVSFVKLLFRGDIDGKLSNRKVRDELKKCLEEAGKTGDPAPFVRLFRKLKGRIRMHDIVRACYLYLCREWEGLTTKSRLREFVRLECVKWGIAKPSDRWLRKIEMEVGLGELPESPPGRMNKRSDRQRILMNIAWTEWIASRTP